MTDYSRWTPGERNEECARRLGWVQVDDFHYGPWEKKWVAPDENEWLSVPDYNSSLDLCVWDLVPVLRSKRCDVAILINLDGSVNVDIGEYVEPLIKTENYPADHDTNPAEAFVLAWLRATEE